MNVKYSNVHVTLVTTNGTTQAGIWLHINAFIQNANSSGVEVNDFNLYQNYPNPFNPETMIKFDIAKAGDVSLTVYNILGEEVTNLHNGFLSAGRYEYTFNASNLSSGIYFYKIATDDFVNMKKMIVLK